MCPIFQIPSSQETLDDQVLTKEMKKDFTGCGAQEIFLETISAGVLLGPLNFILPFPPFLPVTYTYCLEVQQPFYNVKDDETVVSTESGLLMTLLIHTSLGLPNSDLPRHETSKLFSCLSYLLLGFVTCSQKQSQQTHPS